MGTSDDKNSTEKKPSRSEMIALQREAYKQNQKERAKAAKKAYMAKPEVQERLAAQKEKLKDRRRAKTDALKTARKNAKKALADSQKATREKRQQARDEELITMLGRASSLETGEVSDTASNPPKLTVIKGGRIDRP